MAGTSDRPLRLVLSCEHGGNRVPPRWSGLFRGAGELLDSHRGWDPGALRLARTLSKRLGAPLVASTVTRLLVEPNRSLGHPRLFSELTRPLPREERELLLERYWRAHRERVEDRVRDALEAGGTVLHVGVHSFTPVLDGRVRHVDVGLLYDPAREGERALCAEWIGELRRVLPDLRVRANAPYRGVSDGLTTHLRKLLPLRYLGVELEVSQAWVAGAAGPRRRVAEGLASTLGELLAAPAAR